jgi:hypothetical protein
MISIIKHDLTFMPHHTSLTPTYFIEHIDRKVSAHVSVLRVSFLPLILHFYIYLVEFGALVAPALLLLVQWFSA